MNENRGIAAVERVATGLHTTLVAKFQSPMGRVARAVAAIPGVDSVWLDTAWPKTFLASVRSEEVDS